MKKRNNEMVFAILLLAGLWLASNPNCDYGCRTVAEHLVKHGISSLLR